MKSSARSAGKTPAERDIPIQVFRERFVFNRRTGAFFTSSREGAFILEAAWRGLSREEIEKEVALKFGVSAAVAMSDTERFLLRLKEMQLLPEQMRAGK